MPQIKRRGYAVLEEDAKEYWERLRQKFFLSCFYLKVYPTYDLAAMFF